MKQETGKKSVKWLLIVVAIVALLAIVGGAAVGGFLIFGGRGSAEGEGTESEAPASAVYWNLDRILYTQDSETGLSTREPGEDGLYVFRFASEGKLIELKTADKQLVNFIDTMDAVGLVLDENGLIIDVLNVKDVAVEKAKNFYVKKVDGNTITVNSSIAMNGMDIIITLTDAAKVMDVRPDSETLGQPIDLQVFDMVSIYANMDEVVTAVYLHERPESSPLYLRVDRMYDSSTASTTRVPDEKGVYTIPFALHGEVLQLKCKDKNIVTGIDSGTDSKQVMGLTFDGEGYITGTITAATAARGKLICQVYNVTAINGTTIEATRLMSGSEQGKVVSFNLTEETEIVMNETGCNHFIGEQVEDLKNYDRVIVWGDMDGNALYIKIDRRKVEGENIAMYYLKGKKYDSTLKETTRVPDASGYYVYELASKGKMVTVKTKDKALANMMDGDSYQFFGLKVEKGIVKEFYNANCISGGYGIGGQRFVTEVMASIVRIVSGSDFASGGNYMLTDKTEIYNMTGYNGKLGSKTELKVGDRVIANRDVENNITHIYVLDRPVSGTKMYYNKSRSYNSTTLETSRTPDAEGYYVYTLYCEGQELTAKTKDKDIATMIDLQNAPIAALKINKDGIITAAYPAIAGKQYASKVFNFNYVGQITKDKVVSCYYYSDGVRYEASKSYPMAKNCKIYNVSTNYSDHRGEKSSLKVGDRIQALYDIQTGELTHIWIIGRSIDAPLYFHVGRVAPKDGVTQRVPNEDGYYECQLFVDGQIKTFKTKDKDVMSAIDSYSSETFFTLKTDGDIILRADAASSSKRAMNTKVSNQDVMKISGNTIKTERKRPGQSNTGATAELKITSKTKIYDVCYYSENQFKAVKLEKGDRITAYADADGNITYIFVMYPHTREKGYESKCHHCNKTVWWEPYTGSLIATADNVHYYYPTNYVRGSQGTIGKDEQTNPGTMHYTAIIDLNGKTYSAKARNFLVYSDLILIDSVGGAVLEATGYQGGSGGNFLVIGGTVEINDGITVRMMNDPTSKASSGGNFNVSNKTLKDENGKVTKTYVGKITINDAILEGWEGTATGSSFSMNNGTELVFKKGVIKGGTIQLTKDTKFTWKGGSIESNLSLNGVTIPLTGTPDFSGILMTSNGGKVDISNLSTEASIKALPDGVFTTESDNIDAYLNTFVPAVDSCTIVKEGKALSSSIVVPSLTENLQFVPGTQMAACPACEAIVTWKAITQADYGETAYGTPGNGTHLYLAEDLNHTGTAAFMNAPSRDSSTNTPYVACFHLNGHNVTTAKNFAHGSYGILQIMGSGTITGNGTSGATITINTNIATGGMSLLSGTYKKAAGNTTGVVQINNNGGAVWVGKDAIIETEEDELAISVGTSSLIPSNLEIRGTVKGGYVTMAAANPDKGFTNTFVLDGGNVEGGIKLSATNIIGLGGAAKVGGFGLDLTSGAKIMVSKLTEGAVVAVAANGVFTEEIDVAGQKGYYAPAPKYLTIEEVGNTLSTNRDPNAAPDLPKDPATPAKPTLLSVDNSNLVLSDANEALCPVCNKTVVWTAITETTEQVVLEGNMHYYLANDITYAGEEAAIEYETYKSIVTCLHLNGHNITATAGKAIYSGGYLNVMGNGIVIGNGTSQHRGATVEVNSSAAKLNLYGGTYMRADEHTTNPIINVHGNGGEINLYDGAIVDATNNDATQTAVRSWCGAFNMYGGEVKAKMGSALSVSNWTNRSDGTGSGTVNIFGGTVSGTVSAGGSTAKGHLSIYGGTIKGSVTFNANCITIIGGNPVITRLNAKSDAKFTLGKLTTGADITVYGSAGVVFTNQSENVDSYKQYFKAESGKAIEVSEFALKLVASGSTPTPDPEPEPEPTTKFDNSDLVFTSGNKAMCPVCEKEVEWTAITQETHGTAGVGELSGTGLHYYLAEDITYTGTANFVRGPGSSGTLCIHLNGHNWTGTQGRFLFGYGSKSRVMGNGIVASGHNKEKEGGVAWNTGTKTNVDIQLYGGTYTVTPENTKGSAIAIQNNGGDLTIHEGATVIGSATAPAIYVGTSNVRTSVLTIKGAKVYGTVKIANLATAKGFSTTIVVEDAKLNVVELGKDVSFTVKGNTTIEKLIVAEGAKFAVGALGTQAKINVQGNGVITEASANVATYKDQIVSTYGCELSVKDNALVARDLNKIDNSNLVFAEGSSTAVCPYCQVEVEWEAISDDSATFDVQAKKHYYLAKDLSFSGNGLSYDKYGLANMTCLHLNGKNLTAGGRAIYAGGYLNIMGNGIVSGNYTHASNIRGATLDVNAGNSNRLNLFGGTYTKDASNTKMPIVAFFTGGGNINMYEGAIIDGSDTSVVGSTADCVLIANNEGKPGNFTMYGGEIKNGTNTNSHAGNIRVNVYGNFTMYGGTISGGKAPINYGGNIYSQGTLNLLGGTITGGYGRLGGNIATQKNSAAGITPVVNLKNVVISNGSGKKNPEVSGSVSHGGNISIERTTMTIEDGTVITGGNPEGQGGNLRALYCNVTMNGGYIYDGHVASNSVNENVWIVGSQSEAGSFTMNGGVIYANSATIGAGSGIHATSYTTITLAGDAMVLSNPANPNKPIKVDGTLVKDPSWCGVGATNKD